MLLGNAQLRRIRSEQFDDYGHPSGTTPVIWTGNVPIRLVDRSLTVSFQGELNQVHQTLAWLPSRLVADAGGYVLFSIGLYLLIRKDSAEDEYRVLDWSDLGERVLASPSDVRVVVERKLA